MFIGTSLDGFIAYNGAFDSACRAVNPSYDEFMASVDALVIGRSTYETVLAMGGAWPYRNKLVVVLSARWRPRRPVPGRAYVGPPAKIHPTRCPRHQHQSTAASPSRSFCEPASFNA